MSADQKPLLIPCRIATILIGPGAAQIAKANPNTDQKMSIIAQFLVSQRYA